MSAAPLVKKNEEEKKNEVDDLAARVGYRKYFTTRGKRSKDGNARKNAIKQLRKAKER